MSKERILFAVEMGGEPFEKQAGSQGCRFYQAFCAIAVLCLVTFASLLLLCRNGVIPSKQKTALIRKGEGWPPAAPPHDGPPCPMGVVGRAPKKITVHLTASHNIQGASRVTWEKTEILPNGVEFKDNSLVIKTPGPYFVYSQTVFYSVGCQGQTIFLSHKLGRLSSSYGTNITLLSAMNTVCHPRLTHGLKRGEPWYKTIYQGAMFEFLEGDRIFAEVGENTVRYVDTREGVTYFGLFAL
ncbi:tumor necrosis factor-like [Scyliorhinus torazame]|uniref:tumor necrosis factor-like n=1 Tax=Scyliorhinus torazame TaxID=75743 RepID=UPI003B5C6D9F